MSLLKVKWGGNERLVKYNPNKVTIGGRTYPTVKIGNQIWMAENLDYKFNVNGSQIPIGVNGSPTTPAAWYYNNNEADYGIDGTYKCGLLYNWYAAKYLDNNKATLLPKGWHVPSKTEWEVLFSSTKPSSGTKLKALDNTITSNWPSGWNGEDTFMFAALPSGSKTTSGFQNLNIVFRAWSSTIGSNAWCAGIQVNDSASLDDYNMVNGFSLRLVKDA